MSIQDWGAIGEILGAIAVFVTLLYLSIQVRENRRATERSSTISVAEAHGRWRAALFENGDLAELVAKDDAGLELSKAENLRLEALHMELFIANVLAIHTAEDDSPRVEEDYLLDIFNSNPSVQRHWQKRKHLIQPMAPQFVIDVENRLERDT